MGDLDEEDSRELDERIKALKEKQMKNKAAEEEGMDLYSGRNGSAVGGAGNKKQGDTLVDSLKDKRPDSSMKPKANPTPVKPLGINQNANNSSIVKPAELTTNNNNTTVNKPSEQVDPKKTAPNPSNTNKPKKDDDLNFDFDDDLKKSIPLNNSKPNLLENKPKPSETTTKPTNVDPIPPKIAAKPKEPVIDKNNSWELDNNDDSENDEF